MRYDTASTIGILDDPHSRDIPRNNRKQSPQTHGDFRPLVKGGGWDSLTPDIRARFDAMSEHPALITYTGAMTVRRSRLGWAFAQLCHLFGSPLIARKGDNIPVDVNVFPVKGGGICWQRVFTFLNHPPVTVQSTKVVDIKRGLLECVGGGLGMRLQAFEQDEALHFTSNHYFLALGPFHIPLPLLLTPGALHVSHSDEGNNKFRFRLIFRHPCFGVTFYQDGLFVEKET